MDSRQARERFALARVATLSSVGAGGRPHAVPVTFALDGQRIVTAVDRKPKSTSALRRLANIAAHPDVTVLIDFYDDVDWTRLWWARADGVATVADPTPMHIALLVAKYQQYEAEAPPGPMITIEVSSWTGWAYGERSD